MQKLQQKYKSQEITTNETKSIREVSSSLSIHGESGHCTAWLQRDYYSRQFVLWLLWCVDLSGVLFSSVS